MLVTKSYLKASGETRDNVDKRIFGGDPEVRRDTFGDRGSIQMPKKQLIEVEGRELAISNVDKVYFPESGFTKGEVIAFYSEIAEVILPHLRHRPLTLKRFPEGI